MAHPELELISNVVGKGDFSAIRRHGLTPETFETEEGKIVFQWLWTQFHDPRHQGQVPDKNQLLRRFPNFDFRTSRNSIESLVLEIRSTRLKTQLLGLTEEMQQLMDDGEDPALILASYIPQMRDLHSTGVSDDGLLLAKSAALLRQEYLTKKEAGGITGIPYGWDPLDMATSGMQPEEFVVIYGRPKNMKTWIALKICAAAYEANRRVMVYSKEMSREAMMRRMASIICEVDYERLRTGKLTPLMEEQFFETLDMLEQIEAHNAEGDQRRSLFFTSDKGNRDPGAGTVDALAAKAEKFRPDLILVDGFYLMKDGRTGMRSRDHKQVSHISGDLKILAQELSIPIIGTTQANRMANKGKGDDLEELSFADAIGQDADVVMRAFRGKGPSGNPAVLLTFPGVREAQLNPFVVNAVPGADFSLLQSNVDVNSFMKDAKALQEEEEQREKGGTSGNMGSGKRPPPPKKKAGFLRA